MNEVYLFNLTVTGAFSNSCCCCFCPLEFPNIFESSLQHLCSFLKQFGDYRHNSINLLVSVNDTILQILVLINYILIPMKIIGIAVSFFGDTKSLLIYDIEFLILVILQFAQNYNV